jgi:hypothetical protein
VRGERERGKPERKREKKKRKTREIYRRSMDQHTQRTKLQLAIVRAVIRL